MTKKAATPTGIMNAEGNKTISEEVMNINIDMAVQEINNLVGNKLYETAIEVGNYVLKIFS